MSPPQQTTFNHQQPYHDHNYKKVVVRVANVIVVGVLYLSVCLMVGMVVLVVYVVVGMVGYWW